MAALQCYVSDHWVLKDGWRGEDQYRLKDALHMRQLRGDQQQF